jgi:transketolase
VTDEAWIDEARRIAAGVRRRSLEVAIAKNGAYLGQACSSAEILGVLLGRMLRRGEGDVLVLSPAHYTLALWAAMAETGELSEGAFATYGEDGSELEMIGGGGAPGMPFTTGSLAQGLSQAIGLALGRRLLGQPGRVVALLSDGELQEGQTWEALMALAHYRLESVPVVIDCNDSQVDGSPTAVMGIEPVLEKLRAFGLDAVEVDGHDPGAIAAALEPTAGGGVCAVVCRTRMWEGIPSLAGRRNLHFVRFAEGEAERALADLGLLA